MPRIFDLHAAPGSGPGSHIHPTGDGRVADRATPGCTHDLTSARAHGIIQACLTRQILVLADRAYQGAGSTVRTPYYGHRDLHEHYQQFNRDHA
ncbi:hypothetical protein GCM10010339_69410 [Streptomyces alanosinicus]|uniref:DDE Tnp4 domain-containing protein n=1 Tax=Streptomyces alanosinicus TaxID=68171 RepID=A0A919D565_9ACTN|nr:hypothetical protein GCM10010339_69410 [Streptomyces alanosinicus]